MRRFLVPTVFSLAVLSACAVPGAGGSSSSSGGSSSSLGNASSSSGGTSRSESSSSGASTSSRSSGIVHSSRMLEPDVAVPPLGSTLPLEQLCNVLAQGTLKQLALNGGGAAPATQSDCAPAFANEEERLQAEFGRVAAARAAYCDPDAGLLSGVATIIAQSQVAGRVQYHEDKAAHCVQAGRANLPFAQGTWLQDAGTGVDATACDEVLEGLVALGNLCMADFECAAGAYCRRDVTAQDCAGVCTVKAPQGAPCQQGLVRCAGNLLCTQLDDAGPRCVARPQLGEACLPDTLPGGGCPAPWKCTDAGICAQPPTGGQPCEPSVVPYCAPEAYCDTATRLCQQRKAEGETCVGSTCQPCTECYRPRVPAGVDGGPSRCSAFVGLGASCSHAPCHAGLLCIDGTCHGMVASGEACTQVPADSTWRGTCRRSTDVCVGTPATCHARDLEGWPCESTAGRSSQGTCEEGLFCAQQEGGQTVGQCQRQPVQGQACGTRPDLSWKCQAEAPGGPSVTCAMATSTNMGTCVFSSNAPTGAPCISTSACLPYDYCEAAALGDLGTCQRAPGLMSECGVAPWGTHCSQGYCHTEDGGARLCTPWLPLGSSCVPAERGCGPNGQCVADRDGGRTCQGRGAAGAPCDVSSLCELGLECVGSVCSVPQCLEPVTQSSCVESSIPAFMLLGTVFTGARFRWRARRRGEAASRTG